MQSIKDIGKNYLWKVSIIVALSEMSVGNSYFFTPWDVLEYFIKVNDVEINPDDDLKTAMLMVFSILNDGAALDVAIYKDSDNLQSPYPNNKIVPPDVRYNRYVCFRYGPME